ncbi:MAG: hypothetical protein HOL49_02190 [Gammaproteobacteria bacterium]|nr:hypothetical protein [Gammaproteobacteria bacterium]
MKRVIKIVLILFVVYVGIVATFESLLGYFQPQGDGMIVITTTNSEGVRKDRVVSRIDSADQLYVAANHWPRAWYRQTLALPNVSVTAGNATAEYLAVPVEGAEHDRVDADHPLPLSFRILTGFPPRYFIRLDPK